MPTCAPCWASSRSKSCGSFPRYPGPLGQGSLAEVGATSASARGWVGSRPFPCSAVIAVRPRPVGDTDLQRSPSVVSWWSVLSSPERPPLSVCQVGDTAPQPSLGAAWSQDPMWPVLAGRTEPVPLCQGGTGPTGMQSHGRPGVPGAVAVGTDSPLLVGALSPFSFPPASLCSRGRALPCAHSLGSDPRGCPARTTHRRLAVVALPGAHSQR